MNHDNRTSYNDLVRQGQDTWREVAMQHAVVFDSHVLPDGHLACPQQFLHHPNVQFKVFVLFDESEQEVSEIDMELAAAQDVEDDFLSQEDLNYYLALDDTA